MSMVILLDAAPFCKEVQVKIPEIADYEVRRELLRPDKFKGIRRLDDFQKYLDYVPLTTQTMLKAARFWAQVRKQRMPTADNRAIASKGVI